MSASEWLAEMDGPLGYTVRQTVAGEQMIAALRAVMELHAETDEDPLVVDACSECGQTAPCSTVRAIEGALR